MRQNVAGATSCRATRMVLGIKDFSRCDGASLVAGVTAVAGRTTRASEAAPERPARDIVQRNIDCSNKRQSWGKSGEGNANPPRQCHDSNGFFTCRAVVPPGAAAWAGRSARESVVTTASSTALSVCA